MDAKCSAKIFYKYFWCRLNCLTFNIIYIKIALLTKWAPWIVSHKEIYFFFVIIGITTSIKAVDTIIHCLWKFNWNSKLLLSSLPLKQNITGHIARCTPIQTIKALRHLHISHQRIYIYLFHISCNRYHLIMFTIIIPWRVPRQNMVFSKFAAPKWFFLLIPTS